MGYCGDDEFGGHFCLWRILSRSGFHMRVDEQSVKRTVCLFQVNDVCADTLSLVIVKKGLGCLNMHPTHLGVHDELRLKPYFM